MTQYGPISETGPSVDLAANEATGPRPMVEISDKLVHDFGTMPQQDKGTHEWDVKNAGDADLELWMESSTCSCTIATLRSSKGEPQKKLHLKPHESTKINLEWETRNNQNEYAKSATIGTNDPARRSFTLHVKGKVFPPVLVYPPEMLTLNGISNEEPTKTSIAVYSMDRPGTVVSKATTSRPEFMVATPRPMVEAERKQFHLTSGGYLVDIEIKPGMSLGRFREELVIETDHPRQTEIKVSMVGSTTGPISVVPERLRMTDVSSRRRRDPEPERARPRRNAQGIQGRAPAGQGQDQL